MVEPGGYPNLCDSPNDVVGAPRRIRQQGDSLAPLDERAEAFNSAGHGGDTIVNHAPKVEDEPVIAGRQLAHAIDQPKFHGAPHSHWFTDAGRLSIAPAPE